MAKQIVRKNECPKGVFFLAFAAGWPGSVGLYSLPNLFWQCVKQPGQEAEQKPHHRKGLLLTIYEQCGRRFQRPIHSGLPAGRMIRIFWPPSGQRFNSLFNFLLCLRQLRPTRPNTLNDQLVRPSATTNSAAQGGTPLTAFFFKKGSNFVQHLRHNGTFLTRWVKSLFFFCPPPPLAHPQGLVSQQNTEGLPPVHAHLFISEVVHGCIAAVQGKGQLLRLVPNRRAEAAPVSLVPIFSFRLILSRISILKTRTPAAVNSGVRRKAAFTAMRWLFIFWVTFLKKAKSKNKEVRITTDHFISTTNSAGIKSKLPRMPRSKSNLKHKLHLI